MMWISTGTNNMNIKYPGHLLALTITLHQMMIYLIMYQLIQGETYYFYNDSDGYTYQIVFNYQYLR